nr:PREDICTED: ferritin heavy chain-like [Bos mutus]
MLPTSPSQERQNYRPECEAALNSHTTLEFHASFQCLAVAFYLDHDDVGLKHFSHFFLLRSNEHSKTAESLMFLQIQRGGRICFLDIRKPETQHSDAHLCNFLETGYLDQQDKFIKELGDHVSNLSNVGSPEGSLADYILDKLTVGDSNKED